MTIDQLFEQISVLLNRSIVLLVAIATFVFLRGIIQYVLAQGDEKKLQEGKRYMLYGVIGLTVMVSVWGIVNLLVFTVFGGGGGGDPFEFSVPQL